MYNNFLLIFLLIYVKLCFKVYSNADPSIIPPAPTPGGTVAMFRVYFFYFGKFVNTYLLIEIILGFREW